MIKTFACLSLLLLSACQGLGGPDSTMKTGESVRVFPYEVHRERLNNGLTVLMIPMPSDGLVSYWSVVRTGSRDEVEQGVTGFAHFFEHMMFRGTEKRPGKVYDGIVHSMGADANAFTTDDYTAYHLSVSSQDLPTVIDIEADRFRNLKYDEPAFRTEAGAVFGEYRKGRSSPFEVLFEALQNTAFDKHTYKHTTIGFVADIEKMPEQYEYSKTFFQRFYRPENVVLTIAGDFDRAKTMEAIRQSYGEWDPGYQTPPIPVEPEQRKMRRIDVPFEGQTLPIVTLNFKGPAFDAGDRMQAAGRTIAQLYFGETSPLYKRLVIEEQRVEFVAGSFENTRDPGLWTVYAMVKDPGDVRKIEQELWAEVSKAAKDLPDAARLDAVRSNLRYGFLSGLTTPDSVCQAVSRYVAHTGDVQAIDQSFTALAAVTPEDVRAAAQRWLRSDRCTVATISTVGVQLPPALEVRCAIGDPSIPAMPTLIGDTLPQPPVLLPVPADPTVSIQLWFQVGSQNDPANMEGLAELTAAMITEGATRQRSYAGLLEALYPIAGSISAGVDKEMTVLRGSVHRDHASAFADLMVEVATQSAFTQQDFERLRDRAVSAIENDLRYASGEELGKATLMAMVHRGTRYGHPTTGKVRALKQLTLNDVKRFAAAFFTKEHCVLGMGGGYEPALVAKVNASLSAGLPSAAVSPAPEVQPQPVQGRPVRIIHNPAAIGSSISMGVPIDVKRGSREFAALWLANSWLGEHRNSGSHLYQVIREERGLNYGDYSYIEAYPNGGRLSQPPQGVGRRSQMFEIWIRTVQPQHTLFALRAALREVELLRKNGLTQEQFENTKRFLRGYVLHFAESTQARLGYAIDDRYYGIDNHLANFRKQLESLTLDEVNAAIRKHMSIENLAIAIVAKDGEALKKELSAGAPSPMTYGEKEVKTSTILAEDAVIATWPLQISPSAIEVIPVDQAFQ